MSNYPDDIRRFDHDPRSPFYIEWRCPVCNAYEGETECTTDYCETHEEWNEEYDDE